ncbi:MAG TPA: hypothetical protein VLE73_05015 [Candidatus Saccharimonadales bacterium]|nr:hypothetical protein [Candidatus Saccharimonadales bacterium]
MHKALASRLVLVSMAAVLLVVGVFSFTAKTAYAAGETFTVTDANTITASGGEFSDIGTVKFAHQSDGSFTLRHVYQGAESCVLNWAITGLTKQADNTYKGTIATTGDCAAGFLNGPITIGNPTNVTLAGAGSNGGPRAAEDDTLCDRPESWLELNYWMCPLINGASDMTEKLDAAIIDLLLIRTEQIFNTSGSTGTPEATSSAAYFTAWSAFRNIAYAFIIIFSLVMVVSQVLNLTFIDAYTFRKMLPKVVLAIGLIALSWRLMEFLFNMSNAGASAAQEVIKAPFSGLKADIGTQAGDITLSALIGALLLVGAGVGAATLAIAGPGVIGALIVSGAIVVLTTWIVLITRNTIATLLIITSPLYFAFNAFEPLKKIATIGKTVTITILLSVPAVAAWLTITHVAALITYIGGGRTGALVAITIVVSGYGLVIVIIRKVDGVWGQLGNVTGQVTNKVRGNLKNYANKQYKGRNALWQTGALMNENSAIGRRFNSVGRRVGLSKNINATSGKGGMSTAFLARGAQARARREAGLTLMDNVNRDQAEGSPLLKALANNDQANAVLAGSGGVNTMAALRQSAQTAGINPDSPEGQAAIAAAQSVGVNRTNAMTALRTALKNKGRGISAGNVEFMDQAVRNLSRNESEYGSLGHEAAFFARSSGRADLGGTEWISYGRNNAAWQAARQRVAEAGPMTPQQAANLQWQTLADSTMLNGIERTSVPALVGGHDSQIRQSMQTLSRLIQQPTPAGMSDARREQVDAQKLRAAIELKEIQGNLPAGTSGSARDEINQVLYGAPAQGGMGLNPNRAIATQLAENYLGDIQMRDPATGTLRRQNITPEALTTMGRTYAEYDAELAARRAGGGP